MLLKVWKKIWGDGAILVVRSAEGRRSRLKDSLPPQERERQRGRLEKAGIKRLSRFEGSHCL